MTETRELVEHFFRHESGRLIALLTRSLGLARLDLVEDVVQAALMQALQTWSRNGIPDDPPGWLYRAARNKAVDVLRRERTHDRLIPQVAQSLDAHAPDCEPPLFAEEIGDEPLRLLFLCCHDSIPIESRVALALRTVCGFSTAEVARALLTTEANAQKRIVRAKERLREDPDFWELKGLPLLKGRLEAVMAAIYLLFNEGYNAAEADEPIRRDLCDESLRLARMLATHPAGDDPRVFALLALLGFHAARSNARVAPNGTLILLGEQDRSHWDWALIRESMQWMGRSATGPWVSRYHVEAAIAWEHCRAPSLSETNWGQIINLYEMLERVAPSPTHVLNRAVAEAHRSDPRMALALLAKVPADQVPRQYPVWSAVLGELHFRAGDKPQALAAWTEALTLNPSKADRALITQRIELCRQQTDPP